jgi:uncharacterized membrane protein
MQGETIMAKAITVDTINAGNIAGFTSTEVVDFVCKTIGDTASDDNRTLLRNALVAIKARKDDTARKVASRKSSAKAFDVLKAFGFTIFPMTAAPAQPSAVAEPALPSEAKLKRLTKAQLIAMLSA